MQFEQRTRTGAQPHFSMIYSLKDALQNSNTVKGNEASCIKLLGKASTKTFETARHSSYMHFHTHFLNLLLCDFLTRRFAPEANHLLQFGQRMIPRASLEDHLTLLREESERKKDLSYSFGG